LFDPLSVDEIHRVLIGLIRDAEARHRLGLGGVELARRYSIDNSVAQYLELYQRLC
jgi:hypothetical protein